MMFTVDWATEPFDAMHRIVKRNPQARVWIGTVLRLVNQMLETIPEQVGESRDANERVWFVDPLVLSFHIDAERRLVRLVSIRER